MKRLLLVFFMIVGILVWPHSSRSQSGSSQGPTMTLEQLHRLPISGPAYYHHLQELGPLRPLTPPMASTPAAPMINTFHTSFPVTNDYPNQVVEPSVSNVYLNSTHYVTTAFISYPPKPPTGNSLPSVRSVTTTTPYFNSTETTLPLVSPYIQAWDPFLASNTGSNSIGIATTANNDEYMPALTADDTGLFAIPYYKNDVANNRYFAEYWTLRTAAGAVAIGNQWLNPVSSDPYGYTIFPNFIGDYQGITTMVHQDQGRREYWPAWVRIDSSQNPPRGDIWMTDVLP